MAVLLAPGPSSAAPTLASPFEQLYNVSLNTVGFTPGQFIRVGATVSSVSAPNGTDLDVIRESFLPANGGSAVASTTNLGTGLPFTRDLTYVGAPSIGALYTRTVTDSPALRGAWSLRFSDTTGTTTANTQAIPASAAQAPFVQNIALTGTGSNPTFSWAPPAGTTVNGYRINIYDQAAINPTAPFGIVLSRDFAPSTTSLSLQSLAALLPPGYDINTTSKKTIEISLLQTRNGSNTSLGNPNVLALSRVYADFTTTNTGNLQVNLPVAVVNGSKVFNFTVQPNQVYYIDPDVATGYQYVTGQGNPNFASVLIPTQQAQSQPYLLSFLYQGSLLQSLLEVGVQYFFPTGGVSEFSIRNILNEVGASNFITGLSFVGQGLFTGTQTPLDTGGPSPIPEPGTMGLLALASVALWGVRRRRSGV